MGERDLFVIVDVPVHDPTTYPHRWWRDAGKEYHVRAMLTPDPPLTEEQKLWAPKDVDPVEDIRKALRSQIKNFKFGRGF